MSRKKRNKEVQEDQEAQAPAMPDVAFDDRPADGSRYVEEHQAALAPRMPDEQPLATNEAAAIWPGAINEAVEKGELPADVDAQTAEEDAGAAARAHVEHTDETGMTDAQRAFAERVEILRNQDKERLRKLREQRKGKVPLV